MHDGVVLFITPNITKSLGFPRDMWIGRSFIDFVHPKDRSTFASQITYDVAPFSEPRNNNKDVQNSMFVLLRRYRGLLSQGFGVKEKSVSYEPFQLTLSLREAPEEARSDKSASLAPHEPSMLLVVTAIPVRSIYKGKQNHNFQMCQNQKHIVSPQNRF